MVTVNVTLSVQIELTSDSEEDYEVTRDGVINQLQSQGFTVDITSEDVE